MTNLEAGLEGLCLTFSVGLLAVAVYGLCLTIRDYRNGDEPR